jgi:hypothetical protein
MLISREKTCFAILRLSEVNGETVQMFTILREEWKEQVRVDKNSLGDWDKTLSPKPKTRLCPNQQKNDEYGKL